jgi:Holliday junction resolvasome RuvABC endonuclease subunit
MIYIIGVDPGYISGWAVLDNTGKPVDWGQLGTRKKRITGKQIADLIYDRIHEYRPLQVIAEGQFLPQLAGAGQRDRHKAVATLKTARIRGAWELMCESDDIELHAESGVLANKWRGAVWGGRWTTEAAKKNAVKMAFYTWGIRIKDSHHHVAEAMWIGSYGFGFGKEGG